MLRPTFSVTVKRCWPVYFLAGFSFLESLADESLDEDSLLEESFASLESFLSDEDLSSLADSPARDFPA